MDKTEQMAADIALAMNGGEWKDGKWYSKGHREAWIKAVKPYADEIERLREALKLMVDEKCDYMKINYLGDPEQQHTIKTARAALKGDE